MIQPLDIILTGRKHVPPDELLDGVEEVISYIIDGPSHARWYLGEEIFWEQTFPIARFGKMAEIDRNEYNVEIRRHPDFIAKPPGIQLYHRALFQCGKLNGNPYDIPELIWTQFWTALGVDVIDFYKNLYVCSSAINYNFKEIGHLLCDKLIVNPLDLVNCTVKVEEN